LSNSSKGLPSFRRPVFDSAAARLLEPRRFVQVLAGPRQVGKTTLARQLGEALELPMHYASADAAVGFDRAWISAQWEVGRERTREGERGTALLVLDEVQKVTGWSDVVKLHWDEDSHAGVNLKVVLLGSAPLLVRRGLSESLAGRFELIRVPHWTFGEMRAAFGWELDRFVYFGGYPGAASLVDEEERWRRYILDSLVETTLSRDILLLSPVTKPALLRQLFRLGCLYSGQVLSYTKMLGQLQDAGNTTTLAHYVELLSGAGMLSGLQRYSGSQVRQRGSIPKLLVHNNALASAVLGRPYAEARNDPDVWGRLVETAVGAHLLAAGADLLYWRDRNREVDYVLPGTRPTAIEVASGRQKNAVPGLNAFTQAFSGSRPLLVGAQGISLEEFLSGPPERWLGPR
jgi:predicted AAA+ superfamily ATPase